MPAKKNRNDDIAANTASPFLLTEAGTFTAKAVEELVARVGELEAALRSMRELASVSYNGDPWYAEQENIKASPIFEQARKALREEVEVQRMDYDEARCDAGLLE